MNPDPSVRLYESYVSGDAPANASGSRRGYGATAQEAHENAGHWANQAPWVRTRRLVFSDHATAPSVTTPEERAAWDLVGVHADDLDGRRQEAHAAACALLRRGKFASGVRLWLELPQPAPRPVVATAAQHRILEAATRRIAGRVVGASPRVLRVLLDRGWVEQDGEYYGPLFRITEAGRQVARQVAK